MARPDSSAAVTRANGAFFYNLAGCKPRGFYEFANIRSEIRHEVDLLKERGSEAPFVVLDQRYLKMRVRDLGILSLAGASLLPYALAIGQETCVSFESSSDSFTLVSNKIAAPIFLSEDD